MDTVTTREPGTVRGQNSHAAAVHADSVQDSESGELELGIEVFTSDSSSQGAKMLLEQRRARQQRRDRTVRWIWYSLGIVLLVAILLIIADAFFFNTSPRPSHDSESEPPLRPEMRATHAVDR